MDARFERSIDWSKVDPKLSVTISEGVDRQQRVRILFSIDRKPGVNSIKFMRKLGVRVGPRTLKEGENILIADTTLAGVRELSKKPYVTHMSESRQLVPAQRLGAGIRVDLV